MGMSNIYVFDGGVAMKDCRIYVFTALFICLTAVKLCFPDVSEQLGWGISRMICCQADYSDTLQAMGRALGRGQLVQVLNDFRRDTVAAMLHSPEKQQPRELSDHEKN